MNSTRSTRGAGGGRTCEGSGRSAVWRATSATARACSADSAALCSHCCATLYPRAAASAMGWASDSAPDCSTSSMVETRRQSRAGAAETPAKFQYEFNGPYLGPLGVMLGLPVCCYALVALCNGHSCVSVGGLRDGSWSTSQMALPQPLATVDGLTAVLAWCAALVVLHLVLPGRRKQGSVLPDGTRLTYKLNGPCDPLPRLCLERWSMRAASTTT